MSALLDALITQRRRDALSYHEYLQKIVDLTRQAKSGPSGADYPTSLNTAAKRALFDNLGNDESLALNVDAAVRTTLQDGWRSNVMKTRRVRQAIEALLGVDQERVERTLELIKSQNDY